MEKLIIYLCSCLSCFIIISILIEFMDGRYKRTYKSKMVYIGAKLLVTFGIAVINMFEYAYWNFLGWVIAVAGSACVLYYENFDKPVKRILECEILAFFIAVIETLGVAVIDSLLKYNHVEISSPAMLTCLEVSFSKLVIIFLYFMVINKLVKSKNVPYNGTQYLFSFFILLFTMVNIVVVIENMTHEPGNYFVVLNLCGIVLADLYVLYFIKMMNEKTYLEYEVKLLENQADVQYAYYSLQEQKYNRTVQVLHDVNKHLNAIEKLYLSDNIETANQYTNQIKDMLKPLVPARYTGNPILDIILSDKKLLMADKDIAFDITVEHVDLNFLAPIDVTTIWGNLLDNAIEACETVSQKRYISIWINTFHEMVSITIKNSCNPVKWKRNTPVSQKGKNRGIGLLNVRKSVEKYDGNMILKEQDGAFIVEILLNS